MVKLVDTTDLKSVELSRVGSSPAERTKLITVDRFYSPELQMNVIDIKYCGIVWRSRLEKRK